MEFMDSWTMVHDQTVHTLNSVWHHETFEDYYLPMKKDLSSSDTVVNMESVLEVGGENSNVDVEELLYRHPLWVIVILILGYLFVLCFGVLGNFSVLIVVARTPRMSTVTNLFICNLAVADLLVGIFCILPNLLSNIFVPWILGWFLCKTVPYIQGVSVCASIYSLVAISVERCVAIQWPLHTQLTKRTARGIIVMIWIWASLVAAPWAIFFDISAADTQHPELDFCVEVWPEGYQFESYYFLLGNLVLCYLFPLGIISLCYLVIWLKVWRRVLPSDSQSSSIELIHQKAKAGVLKMLIVVVLIFALSWLPLYLIFARIKFGGKLSSLEGELIDFGTPVAQWLGASNSMWNPWIYAFLNVKFRRAFDTLFCGRKWRWRREPTPHHQKPNVNILLKRLTAYKPTNSSSYNVTEV